MRAKNVKVTILAISMKSKPTSSTIYDPQFFSKVIQCIYICHYIAAQSLPLFEVESANYQPEHEGFTTNNVAYN